ncbi:hypothetical protein HN512_05235 [Candidatus Peregrinibacteria bacterium]|nr:hypothetical protein [Candidatus Peregrinibacteria bacterium]MBT3599209.1 hypothetical protein [Candidatus Peregrinibacteria bacterium]MBT4367462.1 hypothetical protein [Candidatus Peregrinibacteria bacterium]MBT4585582.1 hypothetical protein [Candidatus Peregrinibacteria bacterium]MBT6731010.1 hypothetical protein [Candidatus Peregrinibacteria bacterium]
MSHIPLWKEIQLWDVLLKKGLAMNPYGFGFLLLICLVVIIWSSVEAIYRFAKACSSGEKKNFGFPLLVSVVFLVVIILLIMQATL